MQDAVPVGVGKMLAVLGTEINTLKELINEITLSNGVCEIANDNAIGQVIVSGNKENIELLQTLLKKKKIKSIPLKVSAPFHCKLMTKAAENMKDKINNIKFSKPSFQIINNVTAEPVSEPDKIKTLLIKQIFSTVRWRESILKMAEDKIKDYVEIGPGKVLTGMVKRTIKDVNCFSINSIADIKNVVNEFKK